MNGVIIPVKEDKYEPVFLGSIQANQELTFNLPNPSSGAIYLVTVTNSYAQGALAVIRRGEAVNAINISNIVESAYFTFGGVSGSSTQFKVTSGQATGGVHILKITA